MFIVNKLIGFTGFYFLCNLAVFATHFVRHNNKNKYNAIEWVSQCDCIDPIDRKYILNFIEFKLSFIKC